jgi:hypothetical protein
MEDNDRGFGPIRKGIVKPVDKPTLTPGSLTEFENEKNNYVAPVIPLKRDKK